MKTALQYTWKILAAICLFAAVGGAWLRADPIDVGVTVSGTSGNYVLNFSITNNLNPGQGVYFWGVQLDEYGITGSPPIFEHFIPTTWDNSSFGGSSIQYNNNWFDGSTAGVGFGETLSGFVVHVDDLVLPSVIPWFAYGFGHNDPYAGSGNFNNSINPGFEGRLLVDVDRVPDSGATVGLFAMAIAGLALGRRRRWI